MRSTGLMIVLIAFAALHGLSQATQVADSIYHLVRQHSIYSRTADRTSIDSLYKSCTIEARSLDDSLGCVNAVMNDLGDPGTSIRHGQMEWKADRRTGPAEQWSYKILQEKAGQYRNQLTKIHFQQGFVYLRIPSFDPGDSTQLLGFAQALRDSIVLVNQALVKGYILDLRLLAEGDKLAVLAGLGPFLGEGPAIKRIDADGRVDGTWHIREGNLLLDSVALFRLRDWDMASVAEKPLAVLIGPYTSGPGSVAAIALKRRPHTLFAGSATNKGSALVTTRFERDGVTAEFTTHSLADKANTLYLERITPDVLSNHPDQFERPLADRKVRAAIEWMAQHRP